MNIQVPNPQDEQRIRRIYLEAFDAREREMVATLAISLLKEKSEPETLSLVAEIDDTLVGHVAFSPIFEKAKQSQIGFILAPLAVGPSSQKQGVGTALVNEGLRRLRLQNAGFVLVYGDPGYYQRFGFHAELAEQFSPPYTLEFPFGWQALQLDTDKAPDPTISITCVNALNLPELW
ncbi:MAG: N-acetyltransferase [Verrucomicrobiota bacterium]